MKGTLGPEDVSTKLRRTAEMARTVPKALTTLAHHIDIAWLHEAYRRTRKDGAIGIDGQTAEAYAENLEGNLQTLLEKFKAGSYRAPAVRRVHIPKGDGTKTRPIGIPTFEDKVLQRAVAMVMEAVYEQDFHDCSYGFRPRRSAHGALQKLWDDVMQMSGGWVLEVDIEAFYDSLDHGQLRTILDHRIRDGVIRRAIDKWLKAGVMEKGAVNRSEKGTPQGGVISPLLANVYLHDAIDVWFAQEVKPRLRGRATLIRYADDLAISFEREDDARRVAEVLPKRLGKYGLTVHPEKTRLVQFRRPPRQPDPGREDPGHFDFLGFRHYWGKSRKGNWVVQRKTAPSRFQRTLKQIKDWCKRNMHLPVAVQQQLLAKKVRGHYGYFGITGNAKGLSRFFREVQRIWRKWLDRRTGRGSMPWPRFQQLLKQYPLPTPVVVHSIFRT